MSDDVRFGVQVALFMLAALLLVPCLMLVDWSFTWLACHLFTQVTCERIHLP